jgi:hypothetical protein
MPLSAGDRDVLLDLWGNEGWVEITVEGRDQATTRQRKIKRILRYLESERVTGDAVTLDLAVRREKGGKSRVSAVALMGDADDLMGADIPPGVLMPDASPGCTIGIWLLEEWVGSASAASAAHALKAHLGTDFAVTSEITVPDEHERIFDRDAATSWVAISDLLALETAEDRAVEVQRRARTKRIDRQVQQLLDTEAFRVPPSAKTLAEDLDEAPEVTWTMSGLHPSGGNALLIAQYKTGKSTLGINWAAAIADREPFLGEHQVSSDLGRVAIWNYEMTRAQFAAWAGSRIAHPDRAAVLHLRGHGLRLQSDAAQAWASEWLREREIDCWVIDVFSRAFDGNENDNSAVGEFLRTLDDIKQHSGVKDLLLVTHTGRKVHEEGQEHARGATRLDDWADVRMTLTKDKAGNRFLRCNGRDVDLPERRLDFDSATLRLTYAEGARTDRAATRRSTGIEQARASIQEVLRRSPGISAGHLRSECKVRNSDYLTARRDLEGGGLIVQRHEGTSRRWYLAEEDTDA